MMNEPILPGIPQLEIVVFQWSRKHGECLDCGLPAAFISLNGHGEPNARLCAVCAANAAADGETITRIVELE
jgi:hypothetical protein